MFCTSQALIDNTESRVENSILRSEFEEAIKAPKKEKSPEVDNRPAELFQAGGEDMVNTMPYPSTPARGSLCRRTDLGVFKMYFSGIDKGVIALNVICMNRSKQELSDKQDTNALCGFEK